MSGINRSSLRINDVEYELARISQSQGEASVTVGLVEGRNEFQVVVEDVVGNLASTKVNIIRDTTAPILVVESPEENQALRSFPKLYSTVAPHSTKDQRQNSGRS